MSYSFDAKFKGNFLLLWRSACDKTTFVQNLGKNKMFGEIKEVIWLWKIPLSKYRKNNICDCFVDEQIDFQYPDSVEDFDDLLEYFQRKRAPCNKSYFGENAKIDSLIIMDNVPGLADRSEAFVNILTVSRKFGLTFAYIFNTIYPTKQSWKMILSQTKKNLILFLDPYKLLL